MIDTLLQVTSLSGTTIYLDLYDDVSVNLNLSFAEIQDITSRNSGYSQTFRVPGTPKNNQFFNYMFNVNQEGLSFDIQKSVICSINYKGVEMMSGVLRLLKIIIDNNKVDYEVNIQDEVGVFINRISNKLLVDIDYTDLDHSYISTNIKDSWIADYSVSGTTGGLKDGQILYPFAHIGYIYDENGEVVKTGNNSSPLLELAGQVGSISNITTPMRTTGFKPSIQIYSVLQRIFKQNGYNVESEFFATEYFQRLYMPLLFNSETYYINSPEGTDGTSQVTTISNSTPVAFNVTGSSCLTIKGYVDFDEYVFNNGAPVSSGYGWEINGRFYPWTGGDYTFSYSLDLRLPPFEDPNTTEMMGNVYFYKNRTTAYNIKSFATVPPQTSKIVSRQNVVITLAPGDFVELVVEWQQGAIGDCGSYKSVAPDVEARTSVASVTDAPNLVIGSTVVVGDQFTPEYKQLDFLKGLITQFNLVFVKHPYLSDTYIMEPYNDYVGQGNTLNWTDKLDMSKSIEISPITNMVGKAIDFVYKDDADATNSYTKSINNNRTFGTYNFIPTGVTINDTPLKFESFFSPSPLDILTYGGTPNPFLVPQFYGSKDLTVSGTTLTQLLPMKLKPRILHYGGLVPSNEIWYYYDDVATTTLTYSTFPFLSHQNIIPSTPTGQALDLNFGNSSSPQDTYASTTTTNTAYSLYYKDYIDDLLSEEARMVSASFYLTILDINNLQYNDLIFVKDAFYRINKISNFNLINNQTTRVELIKLLNVDITSINPNPPVDLFCNLQTELVEDIQDELANNLGVQQCEPPYPPGPTPTPSYPCINLGTGFLYTRPSSSATPVVREIKVQYDNTFYVGGAFTSYNGTNTTGITYLNYDGSINTSFTNYGLVPGGINSSISFVNTIEKQPDGKLLVGGGFISYSGNSRNRIMRLNSNGTLDTSFVVGTGFNSRVWDIELQPDNKILVGGFFTSYSGVSKNQIMRLNSDGSIDNTFTYTSPSGIITQEILDIKLLSSGKMYIAGAIYDYLYPAPNEAYIYRLNSDGTIDNTFTSPIFEGNTTLTIVEQTDGKILVGGLFTVVNSITTYGLVRLNTDGSVDNTFTASSSINQIGNIIILSDGKLLVSSAYDVWKLNSNGTLDTSFTSVTGNTGNLFTQEVLSLINTNEILYGSGFSSINGYSINSLVKLKPDGTINNCNLIPITPTPTPTGTPTPTPTVTPTPTPTPGGAATLSWSYSETGGANGEMRIYVNGSVVETRTNTSSGTYTLYIGNTIYVEIELLSSCSAPDNKGNVYTSGNRLTLVDGDCFTSSTGTLTTPTYTVIAGDVGTTITLDTFASCDSACL